MASRPLVAVLGAPGSGKGTQCGRLAARLGLGHLSTGDALRREMQRGSIVGARARGYVDGGHLVPDDLVIEVVRADLARERTRAPVVLDGFPRTVRQAEDLERMAPGCLIVAVHLVVPAMVLLRRLVARGRRDDQAAIAHRRLATYRRDTMPLINWLAERGLLVHIDGHRSPDAVGRALEAQLAKVLTGAASS